MTSLGGEPRQQREIRNTLLLKMSDCSLLLVGHTDPYNSSETLETMTTTLETLYK
jgi:chemotaxis methyl-accepting protein methylase